MKLSNILKAIACKIWEHKTLHNCNGDPYLTRWYVFRSKRIGVFLHLFHRSDWDKELHDHPWTFITFLLWRGYIEHTERLEKCDNCAGSGTELEFHTWECYKCRGSGQKRIPQQKRQWPLTVHYRPAEWRHRVELIKDKPAVTLVVRFRERREWGFWKGNQFRDWQKWWNETCG